MKTVANLTTYVRDTSRRRADKKVLMRPNKEVHLDKKLAAFQLNQGSEAYFTNMAHTSSGDFYQYMEKKGPKRNQDIAHTADK